MSGMSNNRARHAEEGVPRGDDQGTCLACRAEAEEAGLSVEEWQPPSLLLPPRGAPSRFPLTKSQQDVTGCSLKKGGFGENTPFNALKPRTTLLSPFPPNTALWGLG